MNTQEYHYATFRKDTKEFCMVDFHTQEIADLRENADDKNTHVIKVTDELILGSANSLAEKYNFIYVDEDTCKASIKENYHENFLTIAKNSKILELKNKGKRLVATFNNKSYSFEDWLMKSQNFQDIKNNYIRKLIYEQDISKKEKAEYKEAYIVLERKDEIKGMITKYEDVILSIDSIEKVKEVDIDIMIKKISDLTKI